MTPKIPKEFRDRVGDQSVVALRDIERLHICRHVSDADGATSSGAVLIAVTPNKKKDDGDAFWCLIGLRRGTKITPYLSNFFP
jgi:hypothetical protein